MNNGVKDTVKTPSLREHVFAFDVAQHGVASALINRFVLDHGPISDIMPVL